MTNIMKNYGKKFQLIKKLVGKDDPLIVEIGAHYGEDTLRLLETFPNANIHCFEPDDRNISIFENKIGYSFKNKEILTDSLIHPSFTKDRKIKKNILCYFHKINYLKIFLLMYLEDIAPNSLLIH